MVAAIFESERPSSPRPSQRPTQRPGPASERPSQRPEPASARPFLKWVGGKTQLLDALLAHTPDRFRRYHEVFLGGGAFYFALARAGRIQRATLTDVNRELIDTYSALKRSPSDVIERLRTHPHEPDTFYRVRAMDPDRMSPADRAARMIYLNRSCFNGLYRVNRSGQFNVPFGKYKNPTICDAPNLLAVSRALAPADLTWSGFEGVEDRAERGDFVYFDPPYVPVSETASFVSYAKDGFGADAQERLASLFERLAGRGVKVMLSNSDTPWIRRRYKRHEIISVAARRNVNCKAEKRGPVGEVIVLAG